MDHGKGTDGRRSDVSPVVSFPPAFARERETSGYEAARNLKMANDAPYFLLFVCCQCGVRRVWLCFVYEHANVKQTNKCQG